MHLISSADLLTLSPEDSIQMKTKLNNLRNSAIHLNQVNSRFFEDDANKLKNSARKTDEILDWINAKERTLKE
jgi:hypothetical protein